MKTRNTIFVVGICLAVVVIALVRMRDVACSQPSAQVIRECFNHLETIDVLINTALVKTKSNNILDLNMSELVSNAISGQTTGILQFEFPCGIDKVKINPDMQKWKNGSLYPNDILLYHIYQYDIDDTNRFIVVGLNCNGNQTNIDYIPDWKPLIWLH